MSKYNNNINVIEINKPNKKQAKKRIKELSNFLSKNWFESKNNK